MTARHAHPREADAQRLETLRRERPAQAPHPSRRKPDRARRIADRVKALIGSWRFILIQSVLLLLWIALNVTAYVAAWDPYPFILLNLLLSFQAAYTAPTPSTSTASEENLAEYSQ